MNTKFLCSLAVAGAFAFGGAASAIAAPDGPEGPANCTFSNGTTTCAHVGAPVVTTSTSAPDQNECTTTSETATTTTTYSAHRGTYNSNGTSVAAPADTSTSSTREVSHYCPPPANDARSTCESLGYTYTPIAAGGLDGYNYASFYTCTGAGLTHDQVVALGFSLQPYCEAMRDGTLSGEVAAEQNFQWNSTYTGFIYGDWVSSCIKVQR